MKGRSGKFAEVGSGDGELRYLLGVTGNLNIDERFYSQNRAWFDANFTFWGIDIEPKGTNVLAGDICGPDFPNRFSSAESSFDVVYSNNVFEHLRRPWLAARNIYWLMKPGAICITIVPFAQRYHAAPADYFRYTHTAIPSLFEDAGPIKILVAGYDILGRRNNWQGSGKNDDIVPIDELGAWRETWFTVSVIEKC